jgi:hypothetical protein
MPIKHLPPAVKQLLLTRNPAGRAAPPTSHLNRIFTETLADARSKPANVERGWLVLSVRVSGLMVKDECIDKRRQTCALLTANCTPAVGHLYRFATREPGASERLPLAQAAEKAATMREAALKSAVFVGVPRVRCARSR